MTDSPPILGYATPRRDRRRSTVDVSGRILGIAQAMIALVALVGLPDAFGPGPGSYTITEGSWTAGVAWYWLRFGAAPLNLIAAAIAVRGAFEPLGQQGRFSRRYAGVTLVGFAVVAVCTVVIDRCPVFVTTNPASPAVNDFRLILSDERLGLAWCFLLPGNPILILLAVRAVVRPIGRAWGYPEL